MKDENIHNKLVDYLDGNLSKEEMRLIEKQLQENESSSQEMEELKQLFSDISSEKEEQPSASLRMNFEQLLVYEKAKQKTDVISLQERTSWKSYIRIAASVLIVISAFLIGRVSINTPSSNGQTAMILEKINSESASQRIAALTLSEKVDIKDTKIIQALINRLLYDDKPSVRLAAVEVLTKFTALEMVKEALIKSLETDKDPAIQIELIHVLAKLQEKRALTPMKNLLKDEKVPEYVKKEVQINIPSVS